MFSVHAKFVGPTNIEIECTNNIIELRYRVCKDIIARCVPLMFAISFPP